MRRLGHLGLTLAGVSLLLAACSAAGRRAGPRDGIPAALVAQARPVGRGVRFHPPATGPVIGSCRRALGRRFGVHVEVFAEDRVVLVATGIGTRRPRRYLDGRIVHAGCYGELVTVDPTGLVLVRPGARVTLKDVFASWGQPLTRSRVAGFEAPRDTSVRVFVGGRRWTGAAGRVPLTKHAEIVVEVAPFVPPHSSYAFPPGW